MRSGASIADSAAEGGEHVRHVLARVELRPRELGARVVRRCGQVGQADVAERAPADRRAVDAVRPIVAERVVAGAQGGRELPADGDARRMPHGVDRFGVRDRHLVGEEGLARQDQRLGGEMRVGFAARERGFRHLDQGRIGLRLLAEPEAGGRVEQHGGCVLLAGLPAHERVRVVRRQQAKPVRRHAAQLHGSREAPQQRRHRRPRHILEREHLLARLQHEHPRVRRRFGFRVQPRGRRRAVRVEQAERDRDHERLFLRLAGRGRRALPQRERVAAGLGIVGVLDRDLGRAGLVYQPRKCDRSMPDASCMAATNSLDRDGLVVVTLEIQIHAAPEILAADHASASCG